MQTNFAYFMKNFVRMGAAGFELVTSRLWGSLIDQCAESRSLFHVILFILTRPIFMTFVVCRT